MATSKASSGLRPRILIRSSPFGKKMTSTKKSKRKMRKTLNSPTRKRKTKRRQTITKTKRLNLQKIKIPSTPVTNMLLRTRNVSIEYCSRLSKMGHSKRTTFNKKSAHVAVSNTAQNTMEESAMS